MSFVWHLLSWRARAHARGPKCSGRRLGWAVELGVSEWRTDMRAPGAPWETLICGSAGPRIFLGREGEGRLELEGGCIEICEERGWRCRCAKKMGRYEAEK